MIFQVSFLPLCSGITPGGAEGLLEIQPRSTVYKAIALTVVLSLQPKIIFPYFCCCCCLELFVVGADFGATPSVAQG